MEKRFNTKYVYRVWVYSDNEYEVFFTSKEEAQKYTSDINTKAGKEVAHMNVWRWEMKIEK